MRGIWFTFLLCIFTINHGYSQRYKLVLQSDDTKDAKLISQITYQKNHKDSVDLFSEIKRISEYLKVKGYFFNQIKQIEKRAQVFTVHYDLGKKISHVQLKVDPKYRALIKVTKPEDTLINIPIEQLETTLLNITSILDKSGYSFSKTQLKDIRTRGDTIQARIAILKSNKRFIDKTIVKGYTDFPKSFLHHYFELSNKKPFSTQVLHEISKKTKQLQFVSELRKPEVLFKEDSTLLYIYLDKKSNNSLDGLLNFVTEDNGDFLLTGNLNLQVNNLFNRGESLNLFWNSAGNERQEFFIKSKLPYLFGSKISSEMNFHIYRQDSTFANTKLNTTLLYDLANRFQIGLSLSTEKSTNTGNMSDITDFSNLFGGIDLRYSRENLKIAINPEVGRRITNTTTNQFKLQSEISYNWKFTDKSSLYLRNRTGILHSNNYFINELYRIGGANSIRGFNEQAFFTENYSYLNAEYRLTTNSNSYLYSITDYGKLFNQLNPTDALGLGIGYVFRKENVEIDLNIAVGRRNSENFDLNNSKLIVSWINFF